jgi:hypothetical protein
MEDGTRNEEEDKCRLEGEGDGGWRAEGDSLEGLGREEG